MFFSSIQNLQISKYFWIFICNFRIYSVAICICSLVLSINKIMSMCSMFPSYYKQNNVNPQYVEVVTQMEKDRRLEQILRTQERGSKVIIFCSTKRLCDQLARSIGRNFGAAAIHGDKSQGERDWALNQFRSGKSPILVATDVAARGLDIKDIRLVLISFEYMG